MYVHIEYMYMAGFTYSVPGGRDSYLFFELTPGAPILESGCAWSSWVGSVSLFITPYPSFRPCYIIVKNELTFFGSYISREGAWVHFSSIHQPPKKRGVFFFNMIQVHTISTGDKYI